MVAELPEAVRKQAEKAKAIQAHIVEGTPLDLDEGTQDVEIETPKEDQIAVQDDDLDKGKDIKPDQDAAQWKHKFDSMQGKYNAEVPQLRAEIAQLNETIKNLNDIIVNLKPQKIEAGEETHADVTPQESLNESDFEDYGDEVVTLAKKVNALIEENQTLRTELKNTRGEIAVFGETVDSVSETVKSATQKSFEAELRALVPNFLEINAMQKWLEWLGQTDEWDTVWRQQRLDEAYATGDARKVASFFKRFGQEAGVKIPGSNGKPKKKANLDDQIEPDTSVGSQEISGDHGFKPVTRKQYMKAAQQRNRGEITAEKFLQITKDFQRSIGEGKIT